LVRVTFSAVIRPGVLARQAHAAHVGLGAGQGDPVGDFLVDGARQHHLGHFHGGFVGDPQAVDEGRLARRPSSAWADLRPAAVDDHGVHAQQLQQHHVGGEQLGHVFWPMAWPPYLITTVSRS
jgi:hypothetical protein